MQMQHNFLLRISGNKQHPAFAAGQGLLIRAHALLSQLTDRHGVQMRHEDPAGPGERLVRQIKLLSRWIIVIGMQLAVNGLGIRPL